MTAPAWSVPMAEALGPGGRWRDMRILWRVDDAKVTVTAWARPDRRVFYYVALSWQEGHTTFALEAACAALGALEDRAPALRREAENVAAGRCVLCLGPSSAWIPLCTRCADTAPRDVHRPRHGPLYA